MTDGNLDWLLDDLDTVEDEANAMPVTVLTGFLGAGKTTLVNRILAGDHGLRIAVLVNDFGVIDIDSELIVGVESGRVSLANGCVCCEVREDLISAVDAVLRSDDELDAIVLEASGLAEPIGIARTFISPGYRGRIRLDGIIAVVDAEQLPGQAEDPATRDLVFAQIGFSDMVILNKIDLANRTRVDAVREFVLDRLPSVRIIETVQADIPYEILTGAGAVDADDPRWTDEKSVDDHRGHQHRATFTSWVYRRDGSFDVAALEKAITKLPQSVYRVKGFVRGTDAPDHRMLLQAVGMRGEVVAHDEWGDRYPSTALVIIAATTGLDRARVEALLDECLTRRG